jgi:NADH:ubiquinone oxidoreductase subunit 6 (subunit J)
LFFDSINTLDKTCNSIFFYIIDLFVNPFYIIFNMFDFLVLLAACIAFIFSVISMASFSAHAAVYFMILTFLATGFVYYIIGSYYVSMMLFIVYVGAVAMLFIFCVMLLDLKSFFGYDRFKYYAYSCVILSFVYLLAFAVDYLKYLNPGLEIDSIVPEEYVEAKFFSKDFKLLVILFTDFTFDIVVVAVILFFVTVVVTDLMDNGSSKKLLEYSLSFNNYHAI